MKGGLILQLMKPKVQMQMYVCGACTQEFDKLKDIFSQSQEHSFLSYFDHPLGQLSKRFEDSERERESSIFDLGIFPKKETSIFFI